MASGLRGPYGLFIILIMVVGVVATGYFFNQFLNPANPCGAPPNYTYSSVWPYNYNGQNYQAANVSFTNTQQTFVIGSVEFVTTAFSDPAMSHLVNGVCATDTHTPVTTTLQVTFSTDHRSETLTIAYQGDLTYSTGASSTHVSPQALILWNPGDPFLILMASNS